jgi:hypothetical protein
MGVIGHWSLVMKRVRTLFSSLVNCAVCALNDYYRKGSERFFHHLSTAQFAHLTIFTEVRAPNIDKLFPVFNFQRCDSGKFLSVVCYKNQIVYQKRVRTLFSSLVNCAVCALNDYYRKGSERFFHHLSTAQFAHLTIFTEVRAPNIDKLFPVFNFQRCDSGKFLSVVCYKNQIVYQSTIGCQRNPLL